MIPGSLGPLDVLRCHEEHTAEGGGDLKQVPSLPGEGLLLTSSAADELLGAGWGRRGRAQSFSVRQGWCPAMLPAGRGN